MVFQPLISVVIPTHNASSTVREAIESVLNQQYEQIEILIVDYHSSDDTCEIVSRYSKVRFIEEPTKGIYQAMNHGILHARGEWLYFMGADDVMYNPLVFKQLFEQCIPETTQLILGKVENIGVTNALVKSEYTNKFSREIYWRNTLHHQGILYHKSIFQKNQYNTKYTILADYALNLTLYLAKTKAYHCQLYFAKSFAGGISKQFTHELYDEELALKNELLPFIPKVVNWFIIKVKRWVKVKN